jgi:hypothetical protein
MREELNAERQYLLPIYCSPAAGFGGIQPQA